MSGIMTFNISVVTRMVDGKLQAVVKDDFMGIEVVGDDPHKAAHELIDRLANIQVTVRPPEDNEV